MPDTVRVRQVFGPSLISGKRKGDGVTADGMVAVLAELKGAVL